MNCPNHDTTDPRVKRTRKLLQDALRSLLQERKLSAISVQDIAEKATVNRATFYAHYEDKLALLSSVLKSDLETVLRSQFSDCVAFSQANVQTVAVTVYRFLAQMRTECPESAKELESLVIAALQESIYELVYYWAKHDGPIEGLKGYSPESIATVASWTIFGGAYQWVQSSRKIPAEKHAGELVELLFRKSA